MASMVMDHELHERINRYLDDAIALESAGITALTDMRNTATDPEVIALFDHHLTETEVQKQRLEDRLHALGGSSNALKGIVNKLGVAAADLMHLGKDKGDKATRHLIEAYGQESIEVATYESLVAAATELGDTETAALAREIQAQEKAMAERLFPHIDPSARAAVHPTEQKVETAPAAAATPGE